jgi:hypothetical protein
MASGVPASWQQAAPDDPIAAMLRVHIVLAIALAAATAALGAGCGSSSSGSSSTAKWADSVCGAIVTWKNDLAAAGTSLKQSVPTKQTLTSAAEQADTATQTLADSLKSLGKPDTTAGAQAQAAVMQLRTELTSGVAAIKSATNGVSGASATLLAVSSASSTLATMATQVSATVAKLEQLDPKGELTNAFSESSSCKSLKSS